MIKKALVVSMLLFSGGAFAVNCGGIPQIVKMGDYGKQEAYVIVRIGDLDYRVGVPSDDATKARLSLLQTALVAEKTATLRFYGETTCTAASGNRTIPNAVYLSR
ncbi:hypothetical protein [Photobacterium sp.]|uniref:hypothetical protein n=1 Tax=Photobacterium sp. TaxID=660 RepID=UPI00299E65B0|nr:hypothetical protein [Photobacterium sp.]MDX1304563.1 hypothetical protein [Photobacterium sp.]